MELFETIWPALLVVLGAGVAFGWSKVKKLVAETPTKIDDNLVWMVEEVLAKAREEKKPVDLMLSPTKERPDAE